MELTVDQLKIVNSKMNGHCLIKGVAGSGKTTVALCKIAKHLQESVSASEKLLVVTYNKTLIQYMKLLSESYGINIFSDHVEIRTIDSIIYQYAKSNHLRLANPAEQRQVMIWAIQKIQEQYDNAPIMNVKNYDFLMEEIDWIKSCHFLIREQYLNIDRTGRFSIGENKIRLQKQSDNRNAIFSLYELYESELHKKGLTDFKSNAIYVLDLLQSGAVNPQKYSYMIVDESQDLTKVQLRIIRELYQEKEEGSILFIADVAQSIYSHSWLSRQSFKSVGFDMSGKSNILSKNFRTTKQIAMAAYTLLAHDNDLKNNSDYVEPVAIERNGMKPKYSSFSSEEEEFSYVTQEIKKLINKYNLKDIAIVARTHAYLKGIQAYLLGHGVDAVTTDKIKDFQYFKEEKVSLFTLHAIKGLEFPVIFIVGMNQSVLPFSTEQIDVERKLLYVGMTRAKNMLYLSSSTTPSVFLTEIDKTCLNIGGEETEPVYEVSVEQQQKDKNIHLGEEERVRQWYIEQLKIRYGYPKEAIELEFPLQYGSRTYYADLVVYKDPEEKKRPFIMIEVKKENADLKQAMQQLESYLVPGNVPEYIAVVNGSKRIVKRVEKVWSKNDIDFQLIEVDDIPAFENGDYDNYCYTDLQHHRKYEYHQDRYDKKILFLHNQENGKERAEGASLKMVGSVAAGNLKYVNISDLQEMILPAGCITSADRSFALTVDGDSMINFGINNQDIIIVKKQPHANEGDIVVAGNTFTDEVTLKQLSFHEENVVLHPGNEKYQDIYIAIQDFFISGVVIGVLHKLG